MDKRLNRPRCPPAEAVQKRIDYTCPKKLAWRNTLMERWRSITGKQSIPKGRQYWAIPNKIKDPDSNLLRPNCEFDQIIKAGFAKPDQCHGVEIIKDIYEDNAKVKGVHSYFGDFRNVMDQQAAVDNFNPAMVVYDSITYAKTYFEYFPSIIRLLTDLDIRDVMVAWNFVVKSRHHDKYDARNLLDDMSENDSIMLPFRLARERKHPWEIVHYAIEYRGSGKGHQSTMATVIFHR